MIAVSLNVGGACTRKKHYKHNEDGRTAPGVCGNGSVPLSHSENVVTRIGIHTHLSFKTLCNNALDETVYISILIHDCYLRHVNSVQIG